MILNYEGVEKLLGYYSTLSRMGSTRLKGKALKNLCNKHVVEISNWSCTLNTV